MRTVESEVGREQCEGVCQENVGPGTGELGENEMFRGDDLQIDLVEVLYPIQG